MSDELLTELLERSASRVPATDPPLPMLLRQGRRDLRRRRTGILSGAVAAVLAVTGAGALVHTLGHHPATLETTTRPASPPSGTKWIGIGRTVVAVPRMWSMWPGLYCGSFDGHDHVTILTSSATISCGQVSPGIPAGDVIELRGVGGLDVAVDLARTGSGVTQAGIDRTQTTLPAGWLAVPAAPSLTGTGASSADDEARALASAGFQVSRASEPAWGDGPRVRTDPEIGTPARIGSTVTVYDRVAAPAVANLTGRLFWVGGPAPGRPTPHPGTVHVVGNGLDQYIPVGKDGRWSFEGPAGTFTVTGSSPGYLSAEGVSDACRAGHPVTLRWEHTTKANVYCQLR
jgi:hypothetical protein